MLAAARLIVAAVNARTIPRIIGPPLLDAGTA
jgi:hypothetical protein